MMMIMTQLSEANSGKEILTFYTEGVFFMIVSIFSLYWFRKSVIEVGMAS